MRPTSDIVNKMEFVHFVMVISETVMVILGVCGVGSWFFTLALFTRYHGLRYVQHRGF